MTAPSKKITAVIGFSLTAALTGCASTDADNARSPSASDNAAEPSSSTYEDGEFEAEGRYGNLPSSIGVTVTLADDRITAVKVTPRATDETSLALQKRFAAAVPRLVVGKDIDSVRLDRVAGNSGTPKGFNDALAQIKAEASS
ncbi:hypothetical protein OG252_46380 [Streptomyces sp. NBC_01352]|uniref:FMN-binding domain-containing protein n=1 Tax=Streptomyces plumbiresistens TaxID=511811 RepID=A0ABP7RNT3_9ACTN|nr:MULTISPECIES: hypothetical protein [unclassified Streptomyces]MCX4703243.1 hypothetical protein [Streptomyces sp. NBC_01373]